MPGKQPVSVVTNEGTVPHTAFDAPLRTGSDDDVRAIMQDQLAHAMPDTPAPIPFQRWSSKKHYFRTDPGNRIVKVRIPGVLNSYTQDVGREDGQEPVKAFHQRRYEQKYTAAERALHDAVLAANNGDRYLTFRQIPNRFEGFLETDSDVIADYVRGLMASGELKNVYEDARLPKDETPIPPHRAVAALRLAQVQEAGVTP